MYREKLDELIQWKASVFRKPLVLRGARHVGKTWLLNEFGRMAYTNCAYLNFEETPGLRTMFLEIFDIKRIVSLLRTHTKTAIDPKHTLIILDEIQFAEGGVAALRNFYELAPQYSVVAASSLPESKPDAFCVRNVDFMTLRPLSFREFLIALNKPVLVEALTNRNWKKLNEWSETMQECLRHYLYVGGMPEVVHTLLETRDWQIVRRVQIRLLKSYDNDFLKYHPEHVTYLLRMIWRSMPAQLLKKNRKFIYQVVMRGPRPKDFDSALQWMIDCGLLLKSYQITEPRVPLSNYEDTFGYKLFLLDVGLWGAMAGLNVETIRMGTAMFFEFNGALTDQYVMQELCLTDRYIAYWLRENSPWGIDFIIQEGRKAIPIDVRPERIQYAKRLRVFCERFNLKKAYRFSLSGYLKTGGIINIPLYAI